VEAENFMTHQYIEFVPSSRVNLLLGANGSGKSSLVCALCLGLGGKTSDMERGKTLASFIQTGKHHAIIRITLAGRPTDGGDWTIRRDLHLRGGSLETAWAINEVAAREDDVLKLVRDEFHVQMDNLCMFLPQEKVGKFSCMNPPELLRETMRSVSRSLEVAYASILRLQSETVTQERELATKRAAFDIVRAELARLERDKDALEEFKRLETRKELLELARPEATYLAAEAEHERLQGVVAELQEEGKVWVRRGRGRGLGRRRR